MVRMMLSWAVVALGFVSAWGVEKKEAAQPCVAVAEFSLQRDDFMWKGAKGNAVEWVRVFRERLQSRFASDGCLRPVDAVAGARFRLEGVVGFGFGTPLVVSISYEIVEGGEGRRVCWADVVQIDASAFAVANLADLVQATAEAAASSVVERTTVNVVPHRVLGRAGTELLVGGGAGCLRTGECLTVFSADREVAVGTVQIVGVDGASARAVVVESEVDAIPIGTKLRRVPLISPWTGDLQKSKIRNDF